MDQTYKEKMACVRLSHGGKQNMIQVLAAGQKAGPRPRRVLRTGLVAAVVTGVLLAAVGAVALTTPVLRAYLGGGRAYEAYVQPLDLSRTVDGYTVTLTDCTGDDAFLYLGIELTGPEGTALPPDLRLGEMTVAYSGFREGIGSGGGLGPVEDDDPADNRMRFVWFQWVERSPAGQELTIAFHDLTRWVWPGEAVVEVEGDWSFGPFPLQVTERAIDLTPAAQIPLLGGETTVTGVKLTPLHVEVTLEGGDLQAIHTTGPEKDGCWGLCAAETTLALYGKDGKQWELPEPNHSGTWIATGNDRTGVCFSYGQLLDLDELGYVEVNGVRIEVTE